MNNGPSMTYHLNKIQRLVTNTHGLSIYMKRHIWKVLRTLNRSWSVSYLGTERLSFTASLAVWPPGCPRVHCVLRFLSPCALCKEESTSFSAGSAGRGTMLAVLGLRGLVSVKGVPIGVLWHESFSGAELFPCGLTRRYCESFWAMI